MVEGSSTIIAAISPNPSLLYPQNPNSLLPPVCPPNSFPTSGFQSEDPPLPLPPPPSPPSAAAPTRRLPTIRISSEYDSESSAFLNKVSCRVFNGLAKVKAQFQSNRNGDINYPQISFITKYLSVLYDYDDQNAVVTGTFDAGSRLQIKGVHDVKSRQGEVQLVAAMPDPSYKFELASAVPFAGLPRTALKFPHGEIRLEEKEDEEEKRALSLSGILRGKIMNGVCTAQFKDEDLNMRYLYKDEEVTFIPSLSVPSNVLFFAFKRRFGPSDKLSYTYNFCSTYWNAVYKHSFGNDFKVKAGYDSEVRLGWASLWVGKEDEGAKRAPMKVKVQLMLQVPQDNIHASALLFRLKKRWDF